MEQMLKASSISSQEVSKESFQAQKIYPINAKMLVNISEANLEGNVHFGYGIWKIYDIHTYLNDWLARRLLETRMREGEEKKNVQKTPTDLPPDVAIRCLRIRNWKNVKKFEFNFKR